MDLEELVRAMIIEGASDEMILHELLELKIDRSMGEAIIAETRNTEGLPDGFLKTLCDFPKTGFSAGVSGLGCRGSGDFEIHHAIADIIGETGAEIDSLSQDDGGVIKTPQGYITAAVDGMHSRLSHYPFLAGFHAARAAVRDVLVMGARPAAILADLHLANDGDIGKVLDYTAGASTAGELLNVPLIGGSTLRIGGDLVVGDRITGSITAVGTGKVPTARHDARVNDVLIMTDGYGGGTITTTALYNGFHDVLLETLNVKSIRAGMDLLDSPIMGHIHAMTDITNGGIRGDAYEFGTTARLKVIINEDKVAGLISPKVLEMLNELGIDFLGISIDSLLFAISPDHEDELVGILADHGVRAGRVGYMEEGKGVFIESINNESKEFELGEVTTPFREAPYTPSKRVVDDDTIKSDQLKIMLDKARHISKKKKTQVIEWIKNHNNY